MRERAAQFVPRRLAALFLPFRQRNAITSADRTEVHKRHRPRKRTMQREPRA
jgi:hypothetical protein